MDLDLEPDTRIKWHHEVLLDDLGASEHSMEKLISLFVSRNSYQLLLKPPLPLPRPRPNLTLGGTNFNADIAPAKPSISTSFLVSLDAISMPSFFTSSSSPLSLGFWDASTVSRTELRRLLSSISVICWAAELRLRCFPERSIELRRSIPSFTTKKVVVLGKHMLVD